MASFYGVLHILVNPIRGETIYNGLGNEYGQVVHIASLRHDGDGSFYIRSKIGAPDRTYRYKLHKDHMMQACTIGVNAVETGTCGFAVRTKMVARV